MSDEILIKEAKTVKGIKLLLGYLGFILMLIGGILILPTLILPFFPSEVTEIWAFLIPAISSLIIGGSLFFSLIYKKKHGQLKNGQDAVIVLAAWVLCILVSAVPFTLGGKLNYVQAIMEATSGYTTTGVSVIVPENVEKIYLFHRSLTQFFGGIGLVLVMISAFSDRYAMRLYTAEGHSDRLLPNLIKSSRTIIVIYCGYILFGFIMYLSFGMSPFDAINHSITALATGGFSTHTDSFMFFRSVNGFASYQTIGIEIVTMVLMVLGATNFIAHLYLFQGKLKKFFCYCETKMMAFMIAIFVPLSVTILLFISNMSLNISDSIRQGSFQAISAMTGTGFATIDFIKDFPRLGSAFNFIMIVLMLIGGHTNSTCGGIKLYRLDILLQSIYIRIRNIFSKVSVVRHDSITQLDGKMYLTNEVKLESNTFIIVYMLFYFLSCFVFMLFGYDFEKSSFEVASLLGTVGLSCGIIAPTLHPFLLIYSSIVMLLGRLEIYVALYAIVYIFKFPFAIKNKRFL